MAKERRAGLGILDRLVLFAAWLVTCGIVYLLGLYVGQGIQERRIGLEDRVLRLPVTSKPPPEGLRPKAETDLTFYDTLVQPPGKVSRADRIPPSAPTGPPASRTATAPPERPAAAPGTTLPATRVAAPRTPEAPPATTPRAPAAPPAAPPAPSPTPAVTRSPGGGFTVLATPTRSKDEADILAQKLRTKGYDVTVVRVLRDGDNWYRVRIGRYGTADQATEAMRNLREREGVPHVFVATE